MIMRATYKVEIAHFLWVQNILKDFKSKKKIFKNLWNLSLEESLKTLNNEKIIFEKITFLKIFMYILALFLNYIYNIIKIYYY